METAEAALLSVLHVPICWFSSTPHKGGTVLVSLDHVIHGIGEALRRREGAYFIGSGISVPSGMPSWLDLLKDAAKPLDITLTNQDDLPRVAQYCVNADNGNRGPLVGLVKRSLSKPSLQKNAYHTAIARTNVTTLWTTNYDPLLENAFGSYAPASRLAVRANDADLTSGTHDFDIEILKIHGCIIRSRPEELVITQEDYEEFETRRPAFSRRLQHDLVNRSIMFIGYSYNDPNIETVVVEARRLSGRATREHYLIAKEETDSGARIRQKLWLDDLRRFGIRSALIKDYKQLGSALDRIAVQSRGKSVYVTGSHKGGCDIASELGELLAHEAEVVLLDGQSEGIGRLALNTFGEACIKLRKDIRQRVCFFPNPYAFNPAFADDPSHIATLKRWRAPLFRIVHVAIFFDGGIGTEAEIEVAREMHCHIIPVPGSTDGLAHRLLSDPGIADRLPRRYKSTANTRTPTAKDIVGCIADIFKS